MTLLMESMDDWPKGGGLLSDVGVDDSHALTEMPIRISHAAVPRNFTRSTSGSLKDRSWTSRAEMGFKAKGQPDARLSREHFRSWPFSAVGWSASEAEEEARKMG